MLVTSRQLDRLLFVNIAMTTGVFAQTATFSLLMVAVEVARGCGGGVDCVIVCDLYVF